MRDCVRDVYDEVLTAAKVVLASGDAGHLDLLGAVVAAMTGAEAFVARVAMADARSGETRCVEELVCRLVCGRASCVKGLLAA